MNINHSNNTVSMKNKNNKELKRIMRDMESVTYRIDEIRYMLDYLEQRGKDRDHTSTD